MKNYFISVVIILFLVIPTSSFADKRTSFVVMGHLYPLLQKGGNQNEKRKTLRLLFDKINDHKADYVIILGDSSLHKEGVALNFKAGFESEVLFAAGNQDLNDGKSKEAYLDKIGYLEKIVETEVVRLIIFNSSESSEYLNTFFSKALTDPEQSGNIKPSILLGHHRIWDDTILSAKSYSHDKSYYFDEIYPILKGRVNAIFAGNSKRQYFTDFKQSPHWGKQNLNNIYWCDRVGSISGYSVGTGSGSPKLGYVKVTVGAFKDELSIQPHYVSLNYEDPIPRGLIQIQSNPEKSGYVEQEMFLYQYRYIMWFCAGLLTAGLVGVFLVVGKKRKASKEQL